MLEPLASFLNSSLGSDSHDLAPPEFMFMIRVLICSGR